MRFAIFTILNEKCKFCQLWSLVVTKTVQKRGQMGCTHPTAAVTQPAAADMILLYTGSHTFSVPCVLIRKTPCGPSLHNSRRDSRLYIYYCRVNINKYTHQSWLSLGGTANSKALIKLIMELQVYKPALFTCAFTNCHQLKFTYPNVHYSNSILVKIKIL